MTLRNLIDNSNIQEVCERLVAMHQDCNMGDPTLGYEMVLQQLKNLPHNPTSSNLILSYVKDDFDEPPSFYYSVSVENPNYIGKPPANLKSYYLKDVPDASTHYYAFDERYVPDFGFFGYRRSNIIDGEIKLTESASDMNPSHEEILAEILWEITFYGIEEKKVIEIEDEIMQIKDEFDAMELENAAQQSAKSVQEFTQSFLGVLNAQQH